MIEFNKNKRIEGHGMCSEYINCRVNFGNESSLTYSIRMGAYSSEKYPTLEELYFACEQIYNALLENN